MTLPVRAVLQGEAAAAQAMAASGLPLGASLEGEQAIAGTTDYPAASFNTSAPSSSASPYAPSSSAPSSAPAAAVFSAARQHGSNDGSASGTPTAAAGSSASLAAEPLAVQSLLGFIKTRKLAGVARQPPSHRSSSGSTASAHGGAGASSAGSAAAAAAGGIAAQGRKVWIQPSGEVLCVNRKVVLVVRQLYRTCLTQHAKCCWQKSSPVLELKQHLACCKQVA